MAYNPNLPAGQATMANSQPVVIASNQTVIPISDNSGSLTVDNNGTFAVQATISSTDTAPATQNITVIDSGSTSTVSANGQSLVTGTATVGSVATFALSSQETVRVQVTGTWTGTVTAEISIDGGTTYFAQGLHQGAFTTSSFTANFVGGAPVAGATHIRLRATAAITGTATVKVTESVNTGSVYIANAAPSGNYISLLNSSTATLTSGSVFTGTAEDVSNFSEMRITVTSNVASATDGLSIQQSPDGTNWDITDTYTIAAATGKTINVPRQAKWFRIVYTNGGTNQASFRLQSILNRTATSSSSQRPGDAYTNETDLEQMQDFLMLYNGTTWDRARGTTTAGAYSDMRGIGGVAPSVSSGNKDTGTLRVAVATDDINMSAIKTSVELIDNAISGAGFNITQFAGANALTGNGAQGSGALRVTVANDSTGILAAVTNVATIGTSVTPGTAAANLGKAEDAAHTSGDVGVLALGVRNDGAATSFSGTDGDYTPAGTDAQGRVYVVQKSPTATLTNVASSASSVTLLSASTSRISALMFNDSTQVCYVKFGTTASTSSYTVQLASNTYYEVPGGYTGRIDAIWASANGNMRLTELS